MILILSQSGLDITTEEVMDWLRALGASAVRINGDDLDRPDASLTFGIEDGQVRVELPDVGPLCLADVRAVWYRRWQPHRGYEREPLFIAQGGAEARKLELDGIRQVGLEIRKLSDFFFAGLEGAAWLSHPERASLNKLEVLRQAAAAGFETPPTLVTTSRDRVADFAARHGVLITKPIGEAQIFVAAGRSHFMYTTELDGEAIAGLPETFFPSLFQARIAKEYELRVFYLDGECHAMAIFSQQDETTRADFRRYNEARPNRSVPYALPEELTERIGRLMRRLRLDTGSLDLIRTPDRRFVFLEVNPIGQLGMVSAPCNYHLERRVAQSLIARAHHG